MTYWCPDGKGGGERRANVRGTEIKGEEIDHLAAYEDTGLEPKKINSLRIDMAIIRAMFSDVEVERMRELALADKEGRCVVLPAKPDQTVYQWRKNNDAPSVFRLEGVNISEDGDITYPYWNGAFTPEDFGKTVFLTREAAEQALEGGKA